MTDAERYTLLMAAYAGHGQQSFASMTDEQLQGLVAAWYGATAPYNDLSAPIPHGSPMTAISNGQNALAEIQRRLNK